MIFYDKQWPNDDNFKSHKFIDGTTFTQFCVRCSTVISSRLENGKIHWYYACKKTAGEVSNDKPIPTCTYILQMQQMDEALG